MSVLIVLVLLFMKCSTLTTSLDFPFQHESSGSGGGDSYVSSAAAKKYGCLDKEREALLLFKYGLIGLDFFVKDFGLLSSWSSQEDCCKWWGVRCSSQTGHVIELHLQGAINASSSWSKISPSLLELHHLNYLDLSDNTFFYQPIPEFIGSLTNLKYLNLSNCKFGETIHPQLGNLSNLNYLDLSHNSFSGQSIPKFIGSLAKLKYLDLSFAEFSGSIPSQLGNLSNLNYLSLADYLGMNGSLLLETNLEWLLHLTSLHHLDLSRVDLSKANHWIDIISCPHFLSYVRFANCQLSSVSTSLDNLTLWQNHLNVPTPNALKNLCSLQSLDLSYNNIRWNLPDFLNNLQAGCAVVTLEELAVSGNFLTGSLPDEIIKFSFLKTLDLSGNLLNGSVPEDLGMLSKLESLDISFNSLQGSLSEAHFLNLSNLFHLELALNSLVLEVSSDWVPSFQLKYLNMNSCKLGPNSSDWIFQTQKRLSSLDIANCGISANIPTSFWEGLNGLIYLNLSTNQFRGKVTDFPSNFGIYSYPRIDLSSNLFEGPIPRFPSSSTTLNLSRNKFSGSLSLFCQITGKEITFIDISHNLVTGGLPQCLMQFTKLVVLNLAHNKLSQSIPASIESLLQLETLNLYNNSFFGELPLSMRNCTSLSFLDLGGNEFSGNVPSWIGENLRILYALSLRSNKFSGVIPSHLCYLEKLQILDLSVNNLFGRIPSCLNNLSAMVEGESSRKVSSHEYYANVYEYPDSYYGYTYLDDAMVKWQGREMEFENNLGLLKIIDLSSNQLTGEVPDSITSLRGLVVLDLSRNKLHGKIPVEIGQMKSLLSLNLSENSFSGHLPMGLSTLSSLNSLDLSHNNFSGRIPTGTQLQSFNASIYAGNTGLCGPPLIERCPGYESPRTPDDPKEDNDESLKWLYIGIASGFITGFCGVCGFLLLSRRGRHAFYGFFDSLKDSIYVQVAIHLPNRRV